MTELWTKAEREERVVGSDAISRELKQFRHLQHLDNAEVAFRMASTVPKVVKLREQFHQGGHALHLTPIPYGVRLILGQHGISKVNDLFLVSDKDLLAIPGIGRTKLEEIREGLKEFLK